MQISCLSKYSPVFSIFRSCVFAINSGKLISRVSKSDKEFHFQNWFQNVLENTSFHYDQNGRNSFPDFLLVESTIGFEIKGLSIPGRWKDFDSNSKVPSGKHNGREIFYVFGRYPKAEFNEQEYPVIDLVIVHGSFLNSDDDYSHKNKNIKGFGTYGDITIRDRKMYISPTPFSLASGLVGTKTLILPADVPSPNFVKPVGSLKRQEASELITGYHFDLVTNELTYSKTENPSFGKYHDFIAYRLLDDTDKAVRINLNIS